MAKYLLLSFALFSLNACATAGQGEFNVGKSGELEFVVPAVQDQNDAYVTLSKASFDVCRTVMDRGFNISKTDLRGIVLLARVKCEGTVDPFAAIKYGSMSNKFKINRIEEDGNHYRFSYMGE